MFFCSLLQKSHGTGFVTRLTRQYMREFKFCGSYPRKSKGISSQLPHEKLYLYYRFYSTPLKRYQESMKAHKMPRYDLSHFMESTNFMSNSSHFGNQAAHETYRKNVRMKNFEI